MNAIRTAEGYNAIANVTCEYYNNIPVIFASHGSFILDCVSREDECPNFAINSDEIEDLYCDKFRCMESIKNHFKSQFDSDSENVNRIITSPDYIETINLKHVKKPEPSQRRQNIDSPAPPTKSKNVQAFHNSLQQLPTDKTQANITTPTVSIPIRQKDAEDAAAQRVPAAGSNKVKNLGEMHNATLDSISGTDGGSIEELAEQLEREIEDEFPDLFTSKESTEEMSERIERELDFNTAEYMLSLQNIDKKCAGLELHTLKEERADLEEISTMELKQVVEAAEQKEYMIFELTETFAARTNIPTNLPTKNPSNMPSQSPNITLTINITPDAAAKSSTKDTEVPTIAPAIKPTAVPTVLPTGLPTAEPTNVRFTLISNLPSTSVEYEELLHPFDLPADPNDSDKIYDWYQTKSARQKPAKITPPKQPPPVRDKVGTVPDFRGCFGDFRGCQRDNNASQEGVLDIRYLCGVPSNYGPTSDGVPYAYSAVGAPSAIARDTFSARSIANNQTTKRDG